jgi:hypothetical protein
MTLMTTTSSTPSNNQVGKLEERLRASARKSGTNEDQFQAALGFPGTGLEDEIAAIIRKYANKARGIVTPVRAEDSGLIPDKWSVYVKGGVRQDFPESEVDLGKLDYSKGPVQDGDGDYVDYDTMMKRAKELRACGSLGLAAALLKQQEEGKEIFPVESRGNHYYIMPLTELEDSFGDRFVACFIWDSELEQWVVDFYWSGNSFSRCVRFVCPREDQPSAT